jgi:AraC-like DNA-binding protein
MLILTTAGIEPHEIGRLEWQVGVVSTVRVVPDGVVGLVDGADLARDRVTADGESEFLPMTTTDNRAGSNMAIRPAHAQAYPAALCTAPALWLEEFRTTDPAEARRFLSQAYDGGWDMKDLSLRSLTHRRYHTPALRLDEVSLTGRGRCALHITDHSSVSVVVTGGWLDRDDPARTVEAAAPTLVTPDLPCVLEFGNGRLWLVSVDMTLLHRVAAEGPMPLPQDIRFLGNRPHTPTDSQTVCRTIDSLAATFASSGMAQRPLIVGTAVKSAAATLLESYPTNINAGQHTMLEVPSGNPLSEALSFIHRNARADIGIDDIAGAVHLTPRAVQYLFRRRLGTTPTEYLRRFRLQRTHDDLVAWTKSTTTVGEIAARWGFAHTGRFAVVYRKTYGVSPHATLRG